LKAVSSGAPGFLSKRFHWRQCDAVASGNAVFAAHTSLRRCVILNQGKYFAHSDCDEQLPQIGTGRDFQSAVAGAQKEGAAGGLDHILGLDAAGQLGRESPSREGNQAL